MSIIWRFAQIARMELKSEIIADRAREVESQLLGYREWRVEQPTHSRPPGTEINWAGEAPHCPYGRSSEVNFLEITTASPG